MIEGPPHFRSAQERKAGSSRRCPSSGPDRPIANGDYGFESGWRRPIAAGAGQPADRDLRLQRHHGRRGVKAARERGVAMPGQLSVAGFDDSDLASMISPALTTIRRPLRDMAQAGHRDPAGHD
jgi:LacI family transcriptional regulator